MPSIDYADIQIYKYPVIQSSCQWVVAEEKKTYHSHRILSSEGLFEQKLASIDEQQGIAIKALYDAGEHTSKKVSSGMSWRGQTFTFQKLRCLVCLAHGLTPREAAKKLSISYATMQAHVSSLRWRLRFNSNKEMIRVLRESTFGETLRLMDLGK